MADRQTEIEAEALRAQPEVKRALEDVQPKPPPGHTFRGATFLVVFALFGAVHYLGAHLEVLAPYRDFIVRFARGALLITFVLAIGKLIEKQFIDRVHDPVARFNLKRITKLLLAFVVGFLAISAFFVNWYAAVVSLGLLSVILGFALQTPIMSFIGWIYILTREPFRVGDRIKIGEATGDVIDVNYLDTTLWEFHGDYLSTDHPSGRLIKFPNAKVLDSTIYNYSWPLFPYVWNEIKLHIAYDSDLEFVAQTMQSTVAEELGSAMIEGVKTYRELLSQTPVDQLEVREEPSVQFRVSDNTWLEAIVRYLVFPKEAGRVKSRLIRKLLSRLNESPERVRFPNGAAR